MPYRIDPAPDAEALAIQYLNQAGVKASSEVPQTRPPAYVTINRIGGPATSPFYDRATLQISAWGDTKALAREVASVAVARLCEMPGAAFPKACVTDARPAGGIAWNPDDSIQPIRPRYIAGVIITTTGRRVQ